jgi:hypothetical protein
MASDLCVRTLEMQVAGEPGADAGKRGPRAAPDRPPNGPGGLLAAPRLPKLVVAMPSDEHSGVDKLLLPRTGLQLPRQLPFDKWLSIGRHLCATASASAWCLGDWLIYGETRFTGRYREAIERSSLEYKTLRNYAWVARRFSLSRRRERLSFAHHAEVAALPEPEQDFWLHKAETLGWSRNDTRREVQASLRERGQLPAHPAGPFGEHADDADIPGAALRLELTAQQLEFIRQAATQSGLTIDAWAALTLEEAARKIVAHEQPRVLAAAVGRTA